MAVDKEREKYLAEKLNPVLHPMVCEMLRRMPEDPHGFMDDYLAKRLYVNRGTIFITGASSGIGKATAKLFQSRGWNVVATMRTPSEETELTQLERVAVLRLDVTDVESIAAAVEAGIERFARIDVLLNNAGYGAYGPLEAFPLERVRAQFDTNVVGLMATSQAVLPHLRANKAGTVINVSSVGGQVAFPFGSLYHGAKFAVEGFSEALSHEVTTFGGRVKIVEPGFIKTDFGGRSFDFRNDQAMEEYQVAMGGFGKAMGAMGGGASEPNLVAEVIWTAATDGSSKLRYIVGADAEEALIRLKHQDDATWVAAMRQQFSL